MAVRPVIDIRHIHRIFESDAGLAHILHDISLSVMPGEFVAITGPSGSGKSTLMNILGCLDTPTSGRYLLEGLNVAELTDDELAEVRALRIGFVFQSFNLLPRMTVLDNVMLPLSYTDVPRREREMRAVHALRAVGLPVDHYDHRTNELSGGQMQRVAIARALVNDPAIILADEPTGNLDSTTGRQVMDAFHALKRTGKTIVLITHDAGIAAEADRAVQIRDGRIFKGAYIPSPSPSSPHFRSEVHDEFHRPCARGVTLTRSQPRPQPAHHPRHRHRIAAVIAMTSLIGGVRNSLISGMGLNAARIVYINCGYPLTDDDLEDLKRLMPDYEAIEGTCDSYTQVQMGDKTVSAGITGASPTFLEMTGAASKLAEGRIYTSAEADASSRVALIGRNGVEAFFGSPGAEAVGKTIQLNNKSYTVLGILDDGMTGTDYCNVYMPKATVLKDFFPGLGVSFERRGPSARRC